jgi:hypothetical protein
VEGVEPSFAGCKPTVFPLDDTPSQQSSGPGGGRPPTPLFKRQVFSRLSYQAVVSVCRAGVEPAQHRGWVTATWARQCPADTSVPWMGFEPTICTLRECRPLRAGPPGYLSVAQVGLEPTASLVLSEGGLPDCLPSHNRSPRCQRAAVPGVGIEPTRAGSKPASLPLADPGILQECPAGVEPACPVWKTVAWAARPRAQERKERESNPQGLSASSRFERGAIANWLALPESLDGWI